MKLNTGVKGQIMDTLRIFTCLDRKMHCFSPVWSICVTIKEEWNETQQGFIFITYPLNFIQTPGMEKNLLKHNKYIKTINNIFIVINNFNNYKRYKNVLKFTGIDCIHSDLQCLLVLPMQEMALYAYLLWVSP